MPYEHPLADACQVEKASYVWLPLLPRDDGSGYELAYYDVWRPVDLRNATRVLVSANATIANLSVNDVPDAGANRGGFRGPAEGSS